MLLHNLKSDTLCFSNLIKQSRLLLKHIVTFNASNTFLESDTILVILSKVSHFKKSPI